jgi:hypothetical protein
MTIEVGLNKGYNMITLEKFVKWLSTIPREHCCNYTYCQNSQDQNTILLLEIDPPMLSLAWSLNFPWPFKPSPIQLYLLLRPQLKPFVYLSPPLPPGIFLLFGPSFPL